MTPQTRLGVNFPNRKLAPDDLSRMVACGFESFVIFVTDVADAPYWAQQARAIRALVPGCQIHVRIEARGELTPNADARLLSEVWYYFAGLADSYRIRNEPNIESAGVTPDQWHAYLHDLSAAIDGYLGSVVHLEQIYVPAVSPGTPDALTWIQASTDAAKLYKFAGVDVHAYGTTAQIEGTVDEYRKTYGGRILVSETNFGAGNRVDLAAYARTIPDTLELLDQHAIESACLFTWEWANPDRSLPTSVNVKDTPVETFLKAWRPSMAAVTDYLKAAWTPSPNFGYPKGQTGRNGHKPVAICDHIEQGTESGTDQWFANTASQVSAHYSVGKDGAVHQHVLEANAAWSNGIAPGEGLARYHSDVSIPWIADLYKQGVNANLVTISIEHEGMSSEPLTEAQYAATLELHCDIFKRYGWPVEQGRIVGHSQINAVDKPFCPGPAFPFQRLYTDLHAAFNPAPALDVKNLSVFPTWALARLQHSQDFRGPDGLAAFRALLASLHCPDDPAQFGYPG